MPVPVGQTVADFTAKLASKDGVSDFRLADQLGDGPVVLAFLPLAFSGGCTKEVCDFRDNLGSFADLDARVFGFCTDHHLANGAFAKSQDLPFGIISDPNREVVERIWETQEVAGVKRVAKRGAMVLDAKGRVLWSWVTDDPKQWIGTAEVRKALA